MPRTSSALACLGSLALATAASAGFSGQATVENAGRDGGGNTIWRVLLESDNPLDKFLAVNGDANVSPLQFSSSSALVNVASPYASGDRLRPPFASTDSYLALGDNAVTANLQFSPGFLGSYTSAYSPAAVVGTSFSQADNGGYFDSNPTTAVNPINGQVLIAQFILADGATFEFSGTASYNDGDTGQLTNIRFDASTTGPTTGACCLGDGQCLDVPESVCLSLAGVFTPGLCADTVCIPFGACCFPDLSCVRASEADCSTLGGAYQGNATKCGPTTCPVIGACCLDDGECSISTANDCESAGGIYQGFLTECSGVVCSGACVIDNDGMCVNGETPASCQGDYQGNGSTCETINPPSLVECQVASFNQNSSEVRSFAKFDDLGGTRVLQRVSIDVDAGIHVVVVLTNLGASPIDPILAAIQTLVLTIENVPGPAPVISEQLVIDCGGGLLAPGESCDFGSPLSFFGQSSDAPANLADFVGLGTFDVQLNGAGQFAFNGARFELTQEPHRIEAKITVTYEYLVTGACCLPGSTCEELIEPDCIDAGGVFQGTRTTCANTDCPKACCFTDGSCMVLTDLDCNLAAGTSQGEGTDCADVLCPAGGACCLGDGTCVDASNLADCELVKGGTYQGDDTMCKATTCTCRPPDIEYTGPCMEICNETTTCTAGGDTNYTFSVLNNSGVDVHWLLLVPEDGTTITPQVVHVVPPLPNGEARAFDLVISGGSGSTCFDLVLCDINVNECCSGEVCIDLAQCCGRLSNEITNCTGPGAYDYSFDLENQTSDAIHHLFVLDPSDTLTIDPVYMPIDPPLLPGEILSQTIQVSGADVENCILLTIHNENFTASCSVEACLSAGCVNFNPCDIDRDGTVGFTDLVRVLGAWGPCPAEPACVEDITGDGNVGFDDVVEVLAQWSTN